MEFLGGGIAVVLIFRFGVPALITWFFEKYVEPRTENATEVHASDDHENEVVSDSAKRIKNELEKLRRRL